MQIILHSMIQERSVREQMEQRRTQNFAELARLGEIESKLNEELDHTKALLTREKARSSNLMEMVCSWLGPSRFAVCSRQEMESCFTVCIYGMVFPKGHHFMS